MMTITKQHVWVKHTLTPVNVLTDDQGQPVVVVDPDQQVLAEEDAAYGCNACSLPLKSDTINTECEGDTE